MKKADKRQKKNEDRGIVGFAMVQNHYFKDLVSWITETKDPRHSSYTTYTQSDLIFTCLMKNVCAIESMRQMKEEFNEEQCIRNLSLLSGHRSFLFQGKAL